MNFVKARGVHSSVAPCLVPIRKKYLVISSKDKWGKVAALIPAWNSQDPVRTHISKWKTSLLWVPVLPFHCQEWGGVSSLSSCSGLRNTCWSGGGGRAHSVGLMWLCVSLIRWKAFLFMFDLLCKQTLHWYHSSRGVMETERSCKSHEDIQGARNTKGLQHLVLILQYKIVHHCINEDPLTWEGEYLEKV